MTSDRIDAYLDDRIDAYLDDRIDAYLDDLIDRLEGTPAERRRMLTESETHLRDSADRFERDGMDVDAAQSAALASFGDVAMITKASNRRRPAALFAAVIRAAAQLGVYGFAAIGIAALFARGLALATSTQWVYGAPAGYTFSAAQCAHWLAVQPTASNCRAAAAMESSDDSFLFVLAVAIIGLIIAGTILGCMRFARRRALRAILRLPRSVTILATEGGQPRTIRVEANGPFGPVAPLEYAIDPGDWRLIRA